MICHDSISEATFLEHSPCNVEFHCFACSHLAERENTLFWDWTEMLWHGTVDADCLDLKEPEKNNLICFASFFSVS